VDEESHWEEFEKTRAGLRSNARMIAKPPLPSGYVNLLNQVRRTQKQVPAAARPRRVSAFVSITLILAFAAEALRVNSVKCFGARNQTLPH
jgi:hypothetical protein